MNFHICFEIWNQCQEYPSVDYITLTNFTFNRDKVVTTDISAVCIPTIKDIVKVGRRTRLEW